MGRFEHVNVTVADPDAVAAVLCRLSDWTIRWSGAAMGDGRGVHVGDADGYVALYAPGGALVDGDSYGTRGGLNHLGVVVEDLGATEALVRELGFAPHGHADYEPGRRFYFDGPEGIEIEVVAYEAGHG